MSLQTGSLSAGQLIPIFDSADFQPAAAVMMPIGVGSTANTLPFTSLAGSPSGGGSGAKQGGYAGVPGPTTIATSANVGAGAGPLAASLSGSTSVDLPGGSLFGVPGPLACVLIFGLVAYLVLWKVHFKGG